MDFVVDAPMAAAWILPDERGQATDAVQRVERDMRLPASIITGFQGNAQAFQASLSTVPLLIIGALVVVYLILYQIFPQAP